MPADPCRADRRPETGAPPAVAPAHKHTASAPFFFSISHGLQWRPGKNGHRCHAKITAVPLAAGTSDNRVTACARKERPALSQEGRVREHHKLSSVVYRYKAALMHRKLRLNHTGGTLYSITVPMVHSETNDILQCGSILYKRRYHLSKNYFLKKQA